MRGLLPIVLLGAWAATGAAAAHAGVSGSVQDMDPANNCRGTRVEMIVGGAAPATPRACVPAATHGEDAQRRVSTAQQRRRDTHRADILAQELARSEFRLEVLKREGRDATALERAQADLRALRAEIARL